MCAFKFFVFSYTGSLLLCVGFLELWRMRAYSLVVVLLLLWSTGSRLQQLQHTGSERGFSSGGTWV